MTPATRATVLLAAVCCATAALAQAPAPVEVRTVPPDSAGPLRTFWRDTLAQRLELPGGTLEVLAERDHANANASTGRYVVRWNGLQVAVNDDSLGALPVVAAVFPGGPTAVVLSTGVHLKVVVLEPARVGGLIAARVFSVNAPGAAVAPLRVVSGPANGAFVVGTKEFNLAYANGTLRLEGPGSRGVTPDLVRSGESEYVAAMQTDLRAIGTAEAAFFANGSKYTDKLQALKVRLTEGNRLIRLRLTADGWAALIGNANSRTVCAAFVGSVPVAPAKQPGEPACI
jgi:hypothetical protein